VEFMLIEGTEGIKARHTRRSLRENIVREEEEVRSGGVVKEGCIGLKTETYGRNIR
jgi:hypothetical protein